MTWDTVLIANYSGNSITIQMIHDSNSLNMDLVPVAYKCYMCCAITRCPCTSMPSHVNISISNNPLHFSKQVFKVHVHSHKWQILETCQSLCVEAKHALRVHMVWRAIIFCLFVMMVDYQHMSQFICTRTNYTITSSCIKAIQLFELRFA